MMLARLREYYSITRKAVSTVRTFVLHDSGAKKAFINETSETDHAFAGVWSRDV
jgi:hypothetical protein